MLKIDISLLERAYEWTAEHYPELEGAEFDAMLDEVADDLACLDTWNDANGV